MVSEKINRDRVENKIQKLDQNKITSMINLGFIVKIIKLALVIANISYFFGFFWYIYCDLAREIIFDYLESDPVH